MTALQKSHDLPKVTYMGSAEHLQEEEFVCMYVCTDVHVHVG